MSVPRRGEAVTIRRFLPLPESGRRELMVKTILVGLDGSEHAQTACRYAVWLGERFGATVIGLHVVDIVSIEGSFFHDISGSLGFEPYFDLSTKMREALNDRGALLLK